MSDTVNNLCYYPCSKNIHRLHVKRGVQYFFDIHLSSETDCWCATDMQKY